MKFHEAMKLLEEGKKVRMAIWPLDRFIYLKNGCIHDDDDNQSVLRLEVINEQWEEYQEPKKKVKMWPALCKSTVGAYPYISSRFFKNEEDAKNALIDFIKLLTEYPSIEVEEL